MFSSRKKTASTIASNPSTLGFAWGDINPFATPFANKENSLRSNSKTLSRSPLARQCEPSNIDVDQLITNNERLAKQNQVLETELQQKDELIRSLREQIDETVIVATKTKLECNRKTQAEVEMLVMQHKHELMGQMQELRQQNEMLQQQLASLSSKNSSTNDRLEKEVMLLKGQLHQQRMETQKLKNDFLQIIMAKEAVVEELQALLANECRKKSQQESSIYTNLDMALTQQTIYQPKHPIGRQNPRLRQLPQPSPRGCSQIRRNK